MGFLRALCLDQVSLMFLSMTPRKILKLLSEFGGDAKMEVLIPLWAVKPCTKVLMNQRVLAMCMKRSKCWILRV